MRQYKVTLTVSVLVDVMESGNVDDVINELEYTLQDTTGKANILDYSISDYHVAFSGNVKNYRIKKKKEQ